MARRLHRAGSALLFNDRTKKKACGEQAIPVFPQDDLPCPQAIQCISALLKISTGSAALCRACCP
ncbi:MAG: hypothetical protein KGJ51_12030 [Acidobacteriota bacterium]|nr:hypothetical protein [Acidobacteriota bacterium]